MSRSGGLAGDGIDGARFNTSGFALNLSQSQENAVDEFIRGAAHVEFTVFVVAVDLAAKFDIVLSPAQGHHVREVEDLFVEELRIAIVTAEIDLAGVNGNLGHAGIIGGDIASVGAFPSAPEFVQHSRAKSVRPAQSELGIILVVGTFETSDSVECRDASAIGCRRVVRIGELVQEKAAEDFVIVAFVIDLRRPLVAVIKLVLRKQACRPIDGA